MMRPLLAISFPLLVAIAVVAEPPKVAKPQPRPAAPPRPAYNPYAALAKKPPVKTPATHSPAVNNTGSASKAHEKTEAPKTHEKTEAAKAHEKTESEKAREKTEAARERTEVAREKAEAARERTEVAREKAEAAREKAELKREIVNKEIIEYRTRVIYPWTERYLWGVSQVVYTGPGWTNAYVDDGAVAATPEEFALEEKRIETKQEQVKQMNWELENAPFKADVEARRFEEEFRLQMTAASPGDITSGFSLNSFLRRMIDQPDLLDADQTPLPTLLQGAALANRINFTDGTGNASLGLLLDEKILWQGVLMEPVFAVYRSAIESQLMQAREAAERGNSLYAIQMELGKIVGLLDVRYQQMAAEDVLNNTYEFYPHIGAKEQIRQLKNSVAILSKGNLSEMMALKRHMQAATVGKLILEMRDRGWHFSGANQGNEAVYTALHHAMKEAFVRGKFK